MYSLRGRIAARVRRRELRHVPAEPEPHQQPEARPQIGVEAGGVEAPRVAGGTGGTELRHPQLQSAKALRTLAMHRPMQPASFLAAMHAAFNAKPKHAHLSAFFKPVSDQVARALRK